MHKLAMLFGLWALAMGLVIIGLGIYALTQGVVAGVAAFLAAPPFLLFGIGMMGET